MQPREPIPDLVVRQSALRRRLSERSLAAFCSIYLENHFPLSNSPMHDEVMGHFSCAIPAGGARIAAAIPHGFGKTTMAAIALPLWSLAFGYTKHCVLMSDTRPRAGEALAAIGRELSHNWRLAYDFPHLRTRTSTAPTARELLIGDAIRVSAISRTAGLNSRRFGAYRPDLVILDDAEGTSRRFKPISLAWLRDAVIGPSSPTANIVVVGSVWDSPCLLEHLLDPAIAGGTWWARRYKAVISYPTRLDLWNMWELVFHGIADYRGRTGPLAAQEMATVHHDLMIVGGTVLWPEQGDVAKLLQLKVRGGWWRFETAMINQPTVHEVVLDMFERDNAPPPNKWTDDAGIMRDSFSPDPDTARVVLPTDPKDDYESWGSLSLGDPPTSPRKNLPGSPRLQVDDLVERPQPVNGEEPALDGLPRCGSGGTEVAK